MDPLLPFLQQGRCEAGCDEAGCGCLAGPVFAAAVVLREDFHNEILNDSKMLTEKQRYALRPIIEECALAYAIGIATNEEVDEFNVRGASYLAMHRAIEKLTVKPDHLLIDGNRFKAYPNIGHTCIVKGDGKFFAIAAASVLAKTYRDDWMNTLHGEFPQYRWLTNKGYPTEAHREAIRLYGTTIYHRKTFRLLPDQLCLEFEEQLDD